MRAGLMSVLNRTGECNDGRTGQSWNGIQYFCTLGANFELRMNRSIREHRCQTRCGELGDERTEEDESNRDVSTPKKFGGIGRTDPTVFPTPNAVGFRRWSASATWRGRHGCGARFDRLFAHSDNGCMRDQTDEQRTGSIFATARRTTRT